MDRINLEFHIYCMQILKRFVNRLDPVEPGSPNQPYTNEVNHHTPSGWCVYSKFAYRDVDDPLRTYRGKDCIETFCNYIKGEACRLYHKFPELPMDPLTKKQWKKYKKATKCHICYKLFTFRDPKVRDHCHYTGLYRGPAHSLCNLRYKIPSYIPVVFHNFSGYDVHLFIRELGAHTSDKEVIAINKEYYISFSIKVPVDSYIDKNGEKKDKLIELRFIDRFKFMSSSLDSLTKNLVSRERNCLVLRITLSYNTTCLPEKEFILMSTLIPGIDLMRHNFLQ